MDIYFSDVFEVDPSDLDDYGAFNVSLVCDLPLFIDPFLLFNSQNPIYRKLHDRIIDYVRFLKRRAQSGRIPDGLVKAWFTFPEVKQNWFGYTRMGNGGHGLGRKFAQALSHNLTSVFRDFGDETISDGSHLEKLALLKSGVGKDNISDFTTNLIKGFLLDYTQEFAKTKIAPELRATFPVEKVRFNYETESWESATYDLPSYRDDFVLLTPRDILTKDDAWISRKGLVQDFRRIVDSLGNVPLRDQLNNYLEKQLSKREDSKKPPTGDDLEAAITATIEQFPAILDYFIRSREQTGWRARAISAEKVERADQFFVKQLARLVAEVLQPGGFYDSHKEARERVIFLKHVIENQGGWRIFYDKRGRVIEQREADVHILFKLVWYGTDYDVSAEANSGRGPADFKVSMGARDKTIVEFKLASNKQLKRNLEHQAEAYEKAESLPVPPHPSLKVIVYMRGEDGERARRILREVGLENDPNVLLVDARSDNKPSGSNA